MAYRVVWPLYSSSTNGWTSLQKDEILFSVNIGRRAVTALREFLLREELLFKCYLETWNTQHHLSVQIWDFGLAVGKFLRVPPRNTAKVSELTECPVMATRYRFTMCFQHRAGLISQGWKAQSCQWSLMFRQIIPSRLIKWCQCGYTLSFSR